MISIDKNKQRVIVGLGKTGLSCVRYLTAHGAHRNHKLIVMDSRENPPGLPELERDHSDIPCILGHFDRAVLCAADEIILSPGVALSNVDIQAAVASGTRVRGDIDLFAEAAKAPIVGITGSNGKSTVTTLVGEMAKQSGLNVGLGGNLGTPALDTLSADRQLYVLELSSFQLETTRSLNAACAVILNISEDHMDRYPQKIDYVRAKQRVFRGARKVVVNDDEPLSQSLLVDEANTVHFGLSYSMSELNPNSFALIENTKERSLAHGFTSLLPVSALKIKGRHNISNALAALAIGYAVNLKMDAMLDVLRRFKGLPHRCQWVRTLNNVDYINDSKGTNAVAVATAIESFGKEATGKVILIAGGDCKGADLSPLKSKMSEFGKLAVLIGMDAPKIESVLSAAVETCSASDLQQAVAIAHSRAAAGDVVLLSPAAASFDMFNNYEHRGNSFTQEVERL